MKYIKHEHIIDVINYLNQLPILQNSLPVGAYEFASDKNHYNFIGDYNVHDLTVEKIEMEDKEGKINAKIYFNKNKFKHTKDLVVEYKNVFSISIERTNEDIIHKDKFGDLIVDEILPANNTVTHEILFTNTKINICCGDLFANWI
jgi:hypothetical protein